MHTNIHAYVHIYKHKRILAYKHTYINAWIQSYIHAAWVYFCIFSLLFSFICLSLNCQYRALKGSSIKSVSFQLIIVITWEIIFTESSLEKFSSLLAFLTRHHPSYWMWTRPFWTIVKIIISEWTKKVLRWITSLTFFRVTLGTSLNTIKVLCTSFVNSWTFLTCY